MRTKYRQDQLIDAINCCLPNAFTQITNDIIKNPNLSAVATKILCILLSNAEGWKTHQSVLKTYMREGSTAIAAGIRNLEEQGYLMRLSYVDSKTKRKMGSFWAYTDCPEEFDITKHLEMLRSKGLEIWKGSAQKYSGENHAESLNKPITRFPKDGLAKDGLSKYGRPHPNNTNSNNTKNTNNTKNKKSDFENPRIYLQKFPREFRLNDEFREAWEALVIHRKNKKQPLHKLTEQGVEWFIKDIVEQGIDRAIELIKRCVQNNYTGVVFKSDKENLKKQSQQPPSKKQEQAPTELNEKELSKLKWLYYSKYHMCGFRPEPEDSDFLSEWERKYRRELEEYVELRKAGKAR